jgi:hypothetical protein
MDTQMRTLYRQNTSFLLMRAGEKERHASLGNAAWFL